MSDRLIKGKGHQKILSWSNHRNADEKSGEVTSYAKHLRSLTVKHLPSILMSDLSRMDLGTKENIKWLCEEIQVSWNPLDPKCIDIDTHLTLYRASVPTGLRAKAFSLAASVKIYSCLSNQFGISGLPEAWITPDKLDKLFQFLLFTF